MNQPNISRFMEKLLDGVEVKWVSLRSLCGLITTGKLNANAMEENGTYPFFTCSEKPYKINTFAFDLEAIIISGNGSQVGHLNYYKGKFNAYQRTYIVGEFCDSALVMYLYHYLNYTLKSYIIQNSRKGSVPYITMPMLESFQIPIPCPDNPKKSLEIQAEIVRILDSFTELTAELTAELEARKKQYEFYRNELLTFEEGAAEWKPLGEMVDIKTGGAASKRMIQENPGKYPVINSGRAPLGFISKWNTENDPIGIASRGSIGTVTWQEGRYFRGALNYSITNRNNFYLNTRYLYHLLLDMEDGIKSISSFGVIPALNAGDLKRLLIPIPPLAEQERIVSILDKFDDLVNSSTQGLVREIELRQKQYEFYREKLLSFPPPVA